MIEVRWGLGRQGMSLVAGFLIFAAVLLASATRAQALPERFFGTSGFPEISAADWQALESAGVGRYRMQIEWDKVTSAGNWRESSAWEKTYDEYFRRAAEHHIAILPFLYTRRTGGQAYYLQNDPELPEWREFVTLVVRRYGPEGAFWKANPSTPQFPVGIWQVWNEPNLAVNTPAGGTPRTYARFLSDTSSVIRGAALSGVPMILTAGLLSEKSAPEYLEGMLGEPGITSAFDGIALHPYANYEVDRARKLAKFKAEVNEFRALASPKSLWITEFGWSTSGYGATHLPSVGFLDIFAAELNEGEQAGLLRESFDWLKANAAALDLRYAAWFEYRDTSPDPETKWDEHAGLRSFDGIYRPSWYSFQQEAGVLLGPNPTWQTESIAANLTGTPALAEVGPGHHLDMVAKGSDNALYVKSWLPGAGWGEWSALGGGTGPVGSAPTAASWGKDRLDVAALDPNKSVDHWWWDGSWHSENIAGNMTSTPALAAVGTGHLELVARGTDNALYHRSWAAAANAWSDWSPVGGGGGTGAVASGPGVASWGNGRLDVVALTAAKSVRHWWFDGSSWQVETIPGEMTSDPAIVAVGIGHLDLVARGTDDALYYRSWTAVSGWSEWSGVAGGTGKVGSGAGLASWGDGRLDVVGLTPEAGVRHWYWGVAY